MGSLDTCSTDPKPKTPKKLVGLTKNSQICEKISDVILSLTSIFCFSLNVLAFFSRYKEVTEATNSLNYTANMSTTSM